MKNFRFPAIFFALAMILSIALPSQAQQKTADLFGDLSGAALIKNAKHKGTEQKQVILPDALIKDIQKFGASSGIVYTGESLFRTDSGGEIWREINLPKTGAEKIAAVRFDSETNGAAIIADASTAEMSFASTEDGGDSWTKNAIRLRVEDARETDLSDSQLAKRADGTFVLTVRVPTSSNFSGAAIYESNDGGRSWNFVERRIELRRDDAAEEKISENWTLKNFGSCEYKKTGCVQETKVFSGARDITPPAIKKLAADARREAKLEAQNSVFAQPPGGATRISLQRGFDKCTAGTVAQMRTWWDNSPLYDTNIYFSGRNRGCTQALLNAAWVDQVSAMGWGIIPTVVGYQAPCTSSTTTAKLSYDAGVAETQGRGEADIAITDANNVGLTQGTVLYYDMERYDETAATAGCRTAVKAFLKGWTDRLKERGYISGVYGSPTNAVADWITLPAASLMDAVWLARYDNIPSVWVYASPSPAIPAGFWENHQRIKQWQGPHNETWGGVTFNIDGDIADGPVAGAPVAKNKNADFDGDGRADISVFRPDTGYWYIINSATQNFSGTQFGASEDIPAPGDFDGDGKTDTAVFRPSTGYWFILTKGGNFVSKQFGQAGDVPVPADYNGDGKAEFAVWRPSDGTWYFSASDSRNTFSSVQFGQNGDKPTVGDYDGDGRADIAVWRPSDGNWYSLKSSNGNFVSAQFGAATDQPAQGDFDGDGRTDYAVFRPSNGTWYVQQTTAGFAFQQFGQAGDLPATGDFDGDGKADKAVFRPSSGYWYLMRSRDGFASSQFGAANDKPVPTAYLPR